MGSEAHVIFFLLSQMSWATRRTLPKMMIGPIYHLYLLDIGHERCSKFQHNILSLPTGSPFSSLWFSYWFLFLGFSHLFFCLACLFSLSFPCSNCGFFSCVLPSSTLKPQPFLLWYHNVMILLFDFGGFLVHMWFLGVVLCFSFPILLVLGVCVFLFPWFFMYLLFHF